MPELPEVETIARELRPLVVGRTVTGFRTDWSRAIRHPAQPDEFGNGLIGREVLDVDRRAKWLVLSLASDPASGSDGAAGAREAAVLAIQVKMTGQLTVVPPETPADKHVHHF